MRVITKIKNRKVPHAKRQTIFGNFELTILAESFVNDDPDGPTEMKNVFISNCYVKPGKQNIPDDELTANDVRNCTTEVWNQRSRNRKKNLGWRTNYEIRNHIPEASLEEYFS